MADRSRPALLDRFPALRKLGLGPRARRIPFVQQLSATDCGAACLAMVLAYHGKQVGLEELRQATTTGKDGVDALSILDAARAYGLRGRGVRMEIEDLELLDVGSILHWELNHFVVFEGVRRGVVQIVDPETGRRRVPLERFRRSFTGVALVLEPGEGFQPGRRRAAGAWRYLAQIARQSRLWPRILVLSLLLQTFALSVPVLMGTLVDRVVPQADVDLLFVVCAGLVTLVAFDFLTSWVRAHLLLHLRTHVDARTTLDFLDHMVDLPYAFFQLRPTGDLLMRLGSNATVREIVTSGALSAFLDGTLVMLYLGILFAASPALGLLVLALGAAQAAIFLATRRRQRDLVAENLHADARAQSYEVEMLSGIETLKAMGGEKRAVEAWSHLFVNVLNASLARGRLDALVESLLATLRLASPLAVLAYGGLKVVHGQMSLGTMLGLSALAAGFLVPLSTLVATAMKFQVMGSYLERIEDVLSAPPEQDGGKVRPARRLTGHITMEHVSFRYAPNAPLVLEDVSLEIRPGQHVAIVGRSGAGKSTLASLLVGLYAPSAGVIRYDGVDLAELDLRSLRRQLGIVTQNTYLFGTSIRENVALTDPTLPIDKVVEAARRACIHDDIAGLPMGYDTPLIDRGASLSGGQRQRLALARALVLEPAVLLLDEATSALDSVTERAVHRQLDALGVTRIVVAHRMSTVAGADLIVVLDAGRLVEHGTHAELLARGGPYARLAATQPGPMAEAGDKA